MKHFAEVTVTVKGIEIVVTDVDYDEEDPEDTTWEDFYIKSDPDKNGLVIVSSSGFDEEVTEAVIAVCQEP